MVIVQATEVTVEMIAAFVRLVPQLDPGNEPPTKKDLEQIVSSPYIVLLLAREEDESGPIVGSASLVTFRTPSAVHFRIEDVVVYPESRGRGVGEALVRAALDRARTMGAKHVDLTSNPARESANRLYRRMGFELRNTNVYRFDLDS